MKISNFHHELILILDFGSQYTQLIARRIRELGVYSEIKSFNFPLPQIVELSPKGIILSGGPSSVYQTNAPLIPAELFNLNIPVLGICYGLQIIAYLFGGQVAQAKHREYGSAKLTITRQNELFEGIESPTTVWMSHGDQLIDLPADFSTLGTTTNSPYCVIRHQGRPVYGLQFHPEVAHTKAGARFLKNFLYNICNCSALWTSRSFITNAVAAIKDQVNQEKVICALSGGVDSSVAAVLVHRAIGSQLTCVFVNNGLLRADEADEVRQIYEQFFSMNFKYIDASERFQHKLQGIIDPEQKRKIIGREFIRIFEQAALKVGEVKYLVQGTLYPDVIESVSVKGPSAVIKSHHNVGGLPEKMNFKLIEPLRELFKDEVRQIGRELGLPEKILGRHPFPGPGLAVRILGEITAERLSILREADKIFIDELKTSKWYDKVWQAFCVLLPVNTVGVMGDERTYESLIALRAVISDDAMTADWAKLPHRLLSKISNRIINEVKGVNRVVYDISSKPPSTIEWE